tara:strand:+ start:6225 stop:6581 length:357 start_codon:yes stop_codon:yes gene_type:complete
MKTGGAVINISTRGCRESSRVAFQAMFKKESTGGNLMNLASFANLSFSEACADCQLILKNSRSDDATEFTLRVSDQQSFLCVSGNSENLVKLLGQLFKEFEKYLNPFHDPAITLKYSS